MTSSWRRGMRVRKIENPSTTEEVLEIAGDNEDTEYPIYREPSNTDTGKTVATGDNHNLE